MNQEARLLRLATLGTALVALAMSLCGEARSKQAASPPSQPENAEQVFSLSFEAMGGRQALDAIQSIRALAQCTGPRGPYQTEIYSARGDRLKFKQISNNGASFVGIVNGKHQWVSDEKTGDVTPISEGRAEMLRGHEFQMIAIVPQERFRHARVAGLEAFAGIRSIRLSAVDGLGKPASLFYSQDSKLLVGMVLVNPINDKESVRVVYKDWKQVGRAKLPAKVTATDESGDFVLNFDQITLNDVDEKIFTVPPPIGAVEELLLLQKQQREAHLQKDAGRLVEIFAPDFINISAGNVDRPSKEESLKRFQAYFDRTVFLEWDDITPPLIRISQDASMAYVIVQKRVRTRPNSEASTQESTRIFAWIETYEKQGGKWRLKVVTSTDHPGQK